MFMHRDRHTLAAVAAFLLGGTAWPAAAQTLIDYRIPSGGHPVNIAPGPGGMWFSEDASRLGLVDSRGVVTERFPVRPPGSSRVRMGTSGSRPTDSCHA